MHQSLSYIAMDVGSVLVVSVPLVGTADAAVIDSSGRQGSL